MATVLNSAEIDNNLTTVTDVLIAVTTDVLIVVTVTTVYDLTLGLFKLTNYMPDDLLSTFHVSTHLNLTEF